MSYYEYKSCLNLYKTKIRGKFYFLNGTVYSRSTRRGAHPNETNSLTHDYNWSFKVSRSNSNIFLLPRFSFLLQTEKKSLHLRIGMICLNFNLFLNSILQREWMRFNFSRHKVLRIHFANNLYSYSNTQARLYLSPHGVSG